MLPSITSLDDLELRLLVWVVTLNNYVREALQIENLYFINESVNGCTQCFSLIPSCLSPRESNYLSVEFLKLLVYD